MSLQISGGHLLVDSNGSLSNACCCEPGFSSLIEPTMRALNEHGARINQTYAVWPNRFYDAAGNLLNGVTGIAPATLTAASFYVGTAGNVTVPVDSFYANDLAWYDIKHGDPAGTYAAVLVNQMIAQLRTNCTWFLNTAIGVEGVPQGTVVDWTTASVGAPAAASATTANYNSKFADVKTALRLLNKVRIVLSQDNRELRKGVGNRLNGANACALTRADASTAYDGSGFAGTGLVMRQYDKSMEYGGPSSILCVLYDVRGSFVFNLTNLRNALGGVYLQCGYWRIPTAHNPPVVTDSLFHIWNSYAAGASYSILLDQGKPSFTDPDCPSSVLPEMGYGWYIDYQILVLNFTWDYTF